MKGGFGSAAILIGMPLISVLRYALASESRRVDDEAAAIAAERIRSGAAGEEDGVEALASLGIDCPEE